MTLSTSIAAFANRNARRERILERLAYSGGIVLLLLLLSAWIVSAETDPTLGPREPIAWSVLGLADVLAVWLLGLGLFVLAPAVVAATVATERRAGTLDQLRTTPLPPLALAAGLVVGAPAKLYLLCAGPLALHLIAGAVGLVHLDTLAATLVIFAAGAIVTSLIGLCVALAPRQDSGGSFVALGVAAVLGVSGLVASGLAGDRESVRWAFLHPAGALQAAMLAHDGLWRQLHVSSWSLDRFHDQSYTGWLFLTPALSAGASLAVGVLLARAACRKLAAPHLPLVSKKQALALFAFATAALVAPLSVSESEFSRAGAMAPFLFGLLLFPVAIVLGALATPSFEAWALALRRGHRTRWWHEEATPTRLVALMAATFLTVVWLKLHRAGFPSAMNEGEAIAFAWAMATALTLPIYMLFGATRWSTPAARFGFAAATGAHLLAQVIVIAMFAGDNGLPSGSRSIERVFVEAGMLASVAVPVWVAWRQRKLAQRTRAGATV
jgi:hypothetical protein